MNARERIRLLGLVEQHLRYNFYPPYPASLVKPCIAAIKSMRDGDGDSIIEALGCTAQEVVERFNLQTFVE